MSDQPTIKEAAEAGLADAFLTGESGTVGEISVSKVRAKDAYDISRQEGDRAAARLGRRPLFRNININGMR